MNDLNTLLNDFRICVNDGSCNGCSRADKCRGFRNQSSVEISKSLAFDILNMIERAGIANDAE